MNRLRAKGPLRVHLSAWVHRTEAWVYLSGDTEGTCFAPQDLLERGCILLGFPRIGTGDTPARANDDTEHDDGEGSYLLPSLFCHHLLMLLYDAYYCTIFGGAEFCRLQDSILRFETISTNWGKHERIW